MTLTKSLMPTQEQEPMKEKIKKYLWVIHLNVIRFFVSQQRITALVCFGAFTYFLSMESKLPIFLHTLSFRFLLFIPIS